MYIIRKEIPAPTLAIHVHRLISSDRQFQFLPAGYLARETYCRNTPHVSLEIVGIRNTPCIVGIRIPHALNNPQRPRSNGRSITNKQIGIHSALIHSSHAASCFMFT